MAQLKDTIVSGNLRVTDTTLTDTLQVTIIKAPTSSGGSTYGPGTSGQILKSNGTMTYWADMPTIPTVNNASLTLKGAGTTVTTFTANSSTNQSLDIVAGSNVTITPDATNHKITIASSYTNTDTKVTQNIVATTTDKNYPLLLSYYESSSTTTTAQTANRAVGIYANAKTSKITLTSGTADTSPGITATRTDTNASVSLMVGSGGTNHGVYSESMSKWLFVTNGTEAQTYNIVQNPSSTTTYAISFGGAGESGVGVPTNGTFTTGVKGHYINDGLGYRTREGVANGTEGLSALVLGNSLASSVAKNKTGYVRQYSTNEYYTDLKPNTLTASRTILLPDAAGTIAVFPAARTSGQVVVTDGTAGGIKSSGYTIAKSVPSDAKFSDTVTTVTTSGSGNAVTSITASNGALTVTKGSTFSLDGHDNKCTVTNGSTTSTNYGIVFAVNPNTTENNTLRKTNDFRYQMKDGAANTEGFATIVLGNTKKLSEANNKSGNIYLYSSGGNWHLINTTSTASNITHTLPATTGTILNSGTTSFTQTLSSGTKIGTIKINGTSTDLYCQTNTNTDTKVTQSETTTANYRPIVFGATNSTDTSTLAATITDQTYVSKLLYAQPRDGILYANRMYLKAPGSRGQLNLLTSKYNVMLRNDDSNTYFLVTAQNDPTGPWTSARPLTINNSTGVCNINGTSSSWATARTLTLGGQLTGSVSVKGNTDMTLNGYMDRAFIYDDNDVPDGHTWDEYAWHKFAEVTITDIFEDRVITFLVSRTHGSSAEHTGILSAKLRTNRSVSYDSAQLKWLVRNSGLSKDDFVMVYTSTYSTSTKAELWCRLPDQYHGLVFTVLKEHQRHHSTDTSWTLVKTPDGTGSTHGSSSYPTTGITGTIISSDGTITNSTTGTATSANALNLTHDNELNFSKLASTGHVWFGYRWNTGGTETSGGTTITTYKFGNANGAGGLAGLEATTSTFKAGTFGDQLIVERTDGANMAGITFKNTSGVLGYIATNTVDGDLYHYGATDTSTMKYVILDSHNYTSYPLPRNIKHIHTASGTEGSAGWVKIARITVTNLYANHPMTFTIAQRGIMQYRIHLVFVNNGSVAAAAISQFIIARDNSWTDTNNNPRAYIIKPSDGIFDLYIRKTEGYDHIFVVDFTKADNNEGNNYSVTWTNVHAADSAITGGTEAVKKLYLTTTTNYAGSSSAGGDATNANAANVTVTDVPSTSTSTDTWKTSYGILFAQNPNTTQSNTLRKSHNLRFYHGPNGTANTVGIGELIVGNNTASGTAGNMQGRLILYSSSSSYHTIVGAATSSARTITIPAATGSIILGTKGSTSYYGLIDGDASTSNWIRGTSNGFLPSASAKFFQTATSSLGTSTWYFKNSYIQYMTANSLVLGAAKTADGAAKGQLKFFSGNSSDATGTVTLECVNDAARTGDYTVKLPTWNGTIPVFEKLFDGALSTVSLSYSDIDEYDLFLITVANSNGTSEQVTVASLWISNVVGVHDMPLIWGGAPSSSGGACNVTSGWIQLSKNSGTTTFSVAHKSNVAQMTSSGWSISSPTYNLYIRKIFGLKTYKRV